MKKLGALVFPGFELLDLFGPLEMFGMLKDQFENVILAEEPGLVRSNGGPSVLAEAGFEAAGYDLLLVPGGMGTRREIENARLGDWLARAGGRSEILMSVCTGSALLARAGLLDGRRATSNKMAFDWVRKIGPSVDWVPEARWVEDGNIFTSSGVSAGMDMSLAVIARLHGTEVARKIAAAAEYHWQEDARLDPFARLHGLV